MGLGFNLAMAANSIKRQKEMQQLGLELERQNKERADALAKVEGAGGAQAQAARNLGLSQLELPERRKATDTEAGALAIGDLLTSLFSRTPARSRVQGPTGEQRFDAIQDRNLRDDLLRAQTDFANEQGALQANLAAREIETQTALTRFGAEDRDVDRAARASEFGSEQQRLKSQFTAAQRGINARFEQTEARLGRDQDERNRSPVERAEAQAAHLRSVKNPDGSRAFTDEQVMFMAFGPMVSRGNAAELSSKTLAASIGSTIDQADAIKLNLEELQKRFKDIDARILMEDEVLELQIKNLRKSLREGPQKGPGTIDRIVGDTLSDYQGQIDNWGGVMNSIVLSSKKLRLDNADLIGLTKAEYDKLDPATQNEHNMFALQTQSLNRSFEYARKRRGEYVTKRNRLRAEQGLGITQGTLAKLLAGG